MASKKQVTKNYVEASYLGNKTSMSGGNLTPRIINTFFLLSLQHYFISHPEYHWTPDPNETEIDIHVDYEEDDNIEKSTPVVIIQNGPVSISPAGIGSGMAYMSPRIFQMGKSSEKLDAIIDSNLQMLVNGSINIMITGISTDDVSELSFEIGMFMQMVKYNAASILQLQNIGEVSVSPVQATSKVGWTNRYIAQLSIPYSFTISRVWKPVNYGVRLEEIQTAIKEKVMGSKSNKRVTVPDNRMYQPMDVIPPREELSKEDLDHSSDLKTE